MTVHPHSDNSLSISLFLHYGLFSLHFPNKCHKNAKLLSTNSVLSSHTYFKILIT